MTTEQAAQRLGVSERTIRGHIERGNLRATRAAEGHPWQISARALREFRRNRRKPGRPAKAPPPQP